MITIKTHTRHPGYLSNKKEMQTKSLGGSLVPFPKSRRGEEEVALSIGCDRKKDRSKRQMGTTYKTTN